MKTYNENNFGYFYTIKDSSKKNPQKTNSNNSGLVPTCRICILADLHTKVNCCLLVIQYTQMQLFQPMPTIPQAAIRNVFSGVVIYEHSMKTCKVAVWRNIRNLLMAGSLGKISTKG